MSKFYAIAFGADGFDGDSGFSLDPEHAVETTEESTLDELLKAHRARLEEAGGADFEDALYETPAGFWILTEKSLEIANIPWQASDGSSDSQIYLCNNISKRLCAHLAVETVGVFPTGFPESGD